MCSFRFIEYKSHDLLLKFKQWQKQGFVCFTPYFDAHMEVGIQE